MEMWGIGVFHLDLHPMFLQFKNPIPCMHLSHRSWEVGPGLGDKATLNYILRLSNYFYTTLFVIPRAFISPWYYIIQLVSSLYMHLISILIVTRCRSVTYEPSDCNWSTPGSFSAYGSCGLSSHRSNHH